MERACVFFTNREEEGRENSVPVGSVTGKQQKNPKGVNNCQLLSLTFCQGRMTLRGTRARNASKGLTLGNLGDKFQTVTHCHFYTKQVWTIFLIQTFRNVYRALTQLGQCPEKN